jgi:Nuclease-related domain
MKLIDLTPKKGDAGQLEKYADKLRQALPFGKSGDENEEALIMRFKRGLDNRFIMLRNFPLAGSETGFPPILLGPPGLVLLNINRLKGFYRAKEDAWWEMNKSTRRFSPGQPNLIKQSQEYAQKLAGLLDERGKTHPDVLPILIFANPGVDVETTNPVIRIVRSDGVENLIASLNNAEEVIDPVEINFLSETFEVIANPEKTIPLGEGEDFFGQDLLVPEKKAPPKLPTLPIPTELPLKPVEEKLKFSQTQWIILAVLVVLTILILMIAIFYAMGSV